MKKLLSVIALAGLGTVATISATACGSAATDTFFEPQVTMPIVYLEKDSTDVTKEQMSDYVSKFITVTFSKEYANTVATISVDTSAIQIDKVGYYTVPYTVSYNGQVKNYEGHVSVVGTNVVIMNETKKITTFKPTIDGQLPDYLEGVSFKNLISGVKDIVVDDSTVRYSVPGTHIVKLTVTSMSGQKANIYREVKVLEAETPSKDDFDKYFTYSDQVGFACRKDAGVTYPKNLMIPIQYNENGTIVNVSKQKQYGCDFKWEEDRQNGVDVERDAKLSFRGIETVIFQDGYKVLSDSFLAIDPYNPEDHPTQNSVEIKDLASIKNVHLPETLTDIQGNSHFSGTKVRTLVLPRSLNVLHTTAFNSAWKLKNLIALSMPTIGTNHGSYKSNSSVGWFDYFTSYEVTNKVVYFHMDYMLGVSSDGLANKRFAEIYDLAKSTLKTRYINSFVNYNKIILD